MTTNDNLRGRCPQCNEPLGFPISELEPEWGVCQTCSDKNAASLFEMEGSYVD